MIKKVFIILLIILIATTAILFLIEKILTKDKNVVTLEVPFSSYFESQGSQTVIGGNFIFKQGKDDYKVYLKRELTNNTFLADFKKNEIKSVDYIIEDFFAKVNYVNLWAEKSDKGVYKIDNNKVNFIKGINFIGAALLSDRFLIPCSYNKKYCAFHYVIGKYKKERGIGLLSSPDKLYGIEIFEIRDIENDEVIFRKADVKFMGNQSLIYHSYWPKDSGFLILTEREKLNFINL